MEETEYYKQVNKDKNITSILDCKLKETKANVILVNSCRMRFDKCYISCNSYQTTFMEMQLISFSVSSFSLSLCPTLVENELMLAKPPLQHSLLTHYLGSKRAKKEKSQRKKGWKETGPKESLFAQENCSSVVVCPLAKLAEWRLIRLAKQRDLQPPCTPPPLLSCEIL